ncbi:MAG: DNA/RNA non-specific endonuclease [Planctomycetia bacterium]|nr:DNA/RNA non-specific endonuclease [Planctomycetia bacterium]
MTRAEKSARLKAMLKQIQPEVDLKALAKPAPSGLETTEAPPNPAAASGVEKVLVDGDRELSDAEMHGLEAIVLKQGRPVVFIRNGRYDPLPAPWTHLNDEPTRQRIQPLFASIGRVDLPNSSVPYGGTAFVVGPGLLMTNRHVAALFTVGLGSRGLIFQSGDAAVDFKREVGSPTGDRGARVDVTDVLMIHPYWDMALLRVTGLPDSHPMLRLSVQRPDDLVNRDVVVVGYPALDPRNDIALQNDLFQNTYEVKRLHPGKLRRRESIRSFQNIVSAATHDSSTLGGNSGSAVVDVATGEVVALHFAGIYLKANFAVPTFELARDPRVVNAGLNFTDRVPATSEFDAAWARLEREAPVAGSATSVTHNGQYLQAPTGSAVWSIPLQVTVNIGTPVLVGGTASTAVAEPTSAIDAAIAATEARMQVPVIYGDLASRKGYDPGFLDLAGSAVVPFPELTTTGKNAAARLSDGSTELKYHKFSVVVHKKRRLGMLTAANVDWRKPMREINGSKPTRKQLTGLDDDAQEQWALDDRIPVAHQLPDKFYTKDGAAFDKGHIVRRDDVTWSGVTGDNEKKFQDIQKGNGDTYHVTNCSPQVKGFNQASRGEDNWGDLENLVQKATKAEKVCVFAGPVLAADDPTFRGRDLNGVVLVQIPRRFWKIIVSKGPNGPEAYGFVLEQDLSNVPLEFAVPDNWKRFMRSIADIEGMLGGLVKLTWLKQHDRFDTDEGRRIAVEITEAGGSGR